MLQLCSDHSNYCSYKKKNRALILAASECVRVNPCMPCHHCNPGQHGRSPSIYLPVPHSLHPPNYY